MLEFIAENDSEEKPFPDDEENRLYKEMKAFSSCNTRMVCATYVQVPPINYVHCAIQTCVARYTDIKLFSSQSDKMRTKLFDHSPAVILSGNAEVQYQWL